MIFCESSKVLENRLLLPNHFKMILRSPLIAPCLKAGQFIQIRCSEECDPLLPRPMSVYRVDGEKIEILYEVVGEGTALMAHAEKGETFEIYGPLGRPFWNVPGAKHLFLIAGGIGLAPFYALAETFLKETRREKPEVTVLFGARTKARVVCEDEFRKLGVGFEVATDDGSDGFHGRVTQLLEKKLSELGRDQVPLKETRSRSVALYACGPNGMMQETCRIALLHNLPCQVSLDEPMACGFGICFGCAVKIKRQVTSDMQQNGGFTYKLACKDGPVFEAREVLWG